MKNIKLWIESLRLSVTIPAGFLVHIGFILSDHKTDWLLAFEAFLIASFAMLQNDYVDRVNDLKKGKTFASDHSAQFRIVLIVGWIIIWSIALFTLIEYIKLLIPVIIISMFYSWTRKVPYLQTLCVAFASASPLIFANGVTISLTSSWANSTMFIAVFLSIFGREIIKDVEDAYTDVGYKFTFVSMGWKTIKEEQQFAAGCVRLGLLFCIMASIGRILEVTLWVQIIYFLGISLVGASSAAWFIRDDTKLGKELFDRGMFLVLFSLLLT